MRRYDKCALDFNGRAWCPTETPENGKVCYSLRGPRSYCDYPNPGMWNKWGYCSPDCPVTVGPGGKLKATR